MKNAPATLDNWADPLSKLEPSESKQIIDYIESIKNKNVVVLGTDEAFALTDANGQIKAFRSNLNLSIKEGTLVKIGWKENSPIIVSAQGFEKFAEKTGASVIFPKDVLVGDKLKPNPFAERDPKNNRILAVHARAVAFKYSQMGLPQVCDWTTIFDVPSYRMIDLLAKAKKTPQAFKLLPNEMTPEANNNETWAKYPFDEATCLWLNTCHKEVLDWFSSIINREKKAMDFAQTFARRNALKHLLGVQKAPHDNWTFPVLSWRPTGNNIIKWDASQYTALQGRVAGMIEGNNEFEHGGTKQLEVKKGAETISEELDNAEIKDDVNPDDPAEIEEDIPSNDVKKTETKPEPEKKKELSQDIKKALSIKKNFPDEWQQACVDLKIHTNPEKLTDGDAMVACKMTGEILDAQNS